MSAMDPSAPRTEVYQVVQLAIAPVFMLTAISTLINVLTGRLARAIDRRRALDVRLPGSEGSTAELGRQEYEFEVQRVNVIYAAISMAVTSALLVATLICVAFVNAFIAISLGRLIAVLFVLAMMALMGSLAAFLREIYLAVISPRAPIP